jgi:hypothetical protein
LTSLLHLFFSSVHQTSKSLSTIPANQAFDTSEATDASKRAFTENSKSSNFRDKVRSSIHFHIYGGALAFSCTPIAAAAGMP